MEDDKALAAIVDKMIAAGESDDDIQFVVGEYRKGSPDGLPTDPAERESIRQQNMAAQAGVGTTPSPVRDAIGTIPGSVAKLGVGAVKGFGKAALAAVDPRTYIGLAGAAADLMVPTLPGAEQRTRDRITGAVKGVTDAVGDPAKTGDIIGQTTAGFVLPRIVPKVPNAMVRTGEAIESVASHPKVHSAAHYAGIATGVGHSVPGGLAVAFAPEALEMTGRALQRGGKAMGGVSKSNVGGTLAKAPQSMEDMLNEARGLQPTPPMPKSVELPPQPGMTPGGRPSITREQAFSVNPADRTVGVPASTYEPKMPPPPPNPNAGGRLVPGPPRVSLEDSLANVLREGMPEQAPTVAPQQPLRPTAPAGLPPANPLAQVGEQSQQPVARVGSAVADTPTAAPDVELVKSELQRQSGPAKTADVNWADMAPKDTAREVIRQLRELGWEPDGFDEVSKTWTLDRYGVSGRGRSAGRLDDVKPSLKKKFPEIQSLLQRWNALDDMMATDILNEPVPRPADPRTAAAVDAPPPTGTSLIREQLEASLAKSGLKVSEVPTPSKSRASGRGSGPSATKGYSRADLESIGLDPDVPLTRPLTERETAIVNAARSQRHEQHYGAAVSDAALKRSTARGTP